MARPRRFGRTRVPRRKTDWIASSVGVLREVDATGAQFNTLIDFNDLTDHCDYLTVRRIVGDFYVNAPVDAAVVNVVCFYGIYLDHADTTGSVLGLSPASAVDADSEKWMHRGLWSIANKTNDINGSSAGTRFVIDMHVDTRVMRKMSGRDVLIFTYFILQNDGITFSNVDEFINIRTLVSLP